MADVKAYDRFNQPITVDEADVGALKTSGGRVATPSELVEEKLQREYSEKGVGAKIGGAVSGLGPLMWLSKAVGVLPQEWTLPPQADAYQHGLVKGVMGPVSGLASHVIDKWNPEAGQAMRDHIKDLEEAYPGTVMASEFGSFLATAGIGGGEASLASRLLPSRLVSGFGHGAAGLAEKGLKALGAEGNALARIASRAAVYGGQGLAEGALLGAMDQFHKDMLEKNPEFSGQKYAAAMAHSGLYGMGLGAVLGGGGALAGEGASRLGERIGEKIAETGASRAKALGRAADKVRDLGEGVDSMGSKIELPERYRWKQLQTDLGEWSGRTRESTGSPEQMAKALREDLADIKRVAAEVKLTGVDDAGATEYIEALRKRAVELEALGKRVKSGMGERELEALLDEAKVPSRKVPKPEADLKAAEGLETGVPRPEYTKAEKLALEQAFGATAPGAKTSRQAISRGYEAWELGETMLKYKILDIDRFGESVIRGDVDTMFDRATKAYNEVGERIGAVRSAELNGSSLSAADWAKVAFDPVMDKAGSLGATRPYVQALERWKTNVLDAATDGAYQRIVDDLQRSAPEGGWTRKEYREALNRELEGVKVDFNRVVKERIGMDTDTLKTLFGAGELDATQAEKLQMAVRQRTEALIMGQLRAAAEATGSAEAVQEIMRLKADFGKLALVRQSLFESGARGLQAQRRIYEPMRGMLYGAATGNIPQVARSVSRAVSVSRGKQLAAWALWNVSKISHVVQTVRGVETDIAKAASGIITPAPARSPRSSGLKPGQTIEAKEPFRRQPIKGSQLRKRETPKDGIPRNALGDVEQKAQQIVLSVRNMVASPGRVETLVANAVSELEHVSPQVAQSYGNSLVRGLALLATIVPPKGPHDSALDSTGAPKLTQGEATRIVETAKYVRRPRLVLDDLSHGLITNEGMTVLKTMLPDVHAALQQEILRGIAYQKAKDRPIPYEQEVKISLAMGFAAHPSMRPESIAFTQRYYDPPPPEDAPGGQPRGSSGKFAESKATQFDRIEEKGL